PQARVVTDVVVDLAHAVEMDDEGEPVAGLEHIEVLLEPKRVRAEIDVLAELQHALDDILDPLVDEGLAAADRDHGRGALRPGVDALLHGEPRLVGLVLADLSAADAGDV